MSFSRRKQSKPRHLNKEDPASPTEPEASQGELLNSFGYPSEENVLCENRPMELNDAEAFVSQTSECPNDGPNPPSPAQQRNYAKQRETEEPEETSENDGNSESDFGGYYRLTAEQVSNGYQYLNDDTVDNDDESSASDTQGCEETLGKNNNDTKGDRETGDQDTPFQATESGRLDAMEDNGLSRTDVNSSRLIENGVTTVPSKMLDVHQLYVVLFQLQQQQLLQLRLIDIIQKRLAENILPTTGDILSSLPDLATVPRLAGPASLFGTLTSPLGPSFPVNGALPSTPLGSARFPESVSSGQGIMTSHCGLPSLWPGLLPLKNLVTEDGAEEQCKRDKAQDQSRSSEGSRVEKPSMGLPVSLASEQRPLPTPGLYEQSSTKSLVFTSSVGDLDDACKKGKLSSSNLSSTIQLPNDQSSVTDPASSDDSAIFRHRCRLCFKVLGSDSALQIHMRSHTGERPYKCNICGNRFTTKGNLKVHFSRHQEQYPHIRMNPDPVPEHLDQLGVHHPPPPPPPPPSQPPPGFSVQPSFIPATQSFNKSGAGGSPSLAPSTFVAASAASINSANRERLGKDDNTGKVKCENSPQRNVVPSQYNYGIFESNESIGGTGHQRTSVSNDVGVSSKDAAQSKVLSGIDIPGVAAPLFPSPLTALSSMSSALPTLRSPLNLSFPSPLAMSAAHGLGMLPSYRFEPPPPLIPFARPPVPSSAKEDDPLEQFMEIQLSESGKLDELVRESEGKVSDPNECAICHRVLSCRSALQMHYRTHTGERPYRCKLCSRTFTTKGNLKTHMSVHRGKANGPAVHRCPVCNRDFTNPLILQQHMRVHANELHKPFPLHTGHMMMPMLNHLFPFHINFPYFGGHGFPQLQQSMPAFPQTNAPKADPDGNSKRKSTYELEAEVKKRKISSEEEEYTEKDYQEDTTESRNNNESAGDASNNKMDENSEMGTAGNQEDNDSEVSAEDEQQEANDGTASNSFDENANDDSYLGRYDEESRNNDAYGKEFYRRRDYSVSTTGEEGERHEEGDRHEENGRTSQSPTPGSNLTSYATYPSLTGQYSSPLTALEERVNALGYPGHRFRQVLQSDLESEANGGKALRPEFGERTEEESGHSYRQSGSYRLAEQSSSMLFGSFGEMSNIVKFGNAGVSQSPGALFHSSGSLDIPQSGKPHVVCKMCGKTFACRSALEIHLRSHTKEKPFQCQICGRAFSTKGNLKQHILMTHSLSSADQDVSSHRSSTPSSSDGSQPPHSTPPTSASILTSTGLGLSNHMLQQVGEAANENESSTGLSDQSPGLGATPPEKKSLMRYLCNVCKKPFSSTSALEIHTRTHTGDRPFVCSLCSKAFTTKGNLKVHMGTHAWNKCPSRRGRRMLMDPLPNFKTPTKDGAIFGRFTQSSAEATPFALLRFPEYFIPKSCGNTTVLVNGFADNATSVSLKFEGSSSLGTSTESSKFLVVSPPGRDASSGSKPVELRTKIKEESNNNRSAVSTTSSQDHCDVPATEVELNARVSPPVLSKGYAVLTSPTAVAQASLLWPTDLSQGHQQVALNCR